MAVRFGRGCLEQCVGRLRMPVLLVTGRSTLRRTGLDLLVDDDTVHAYPCVSPQPTPTVIDAGAARARDIGAETVVGVGGGSAMDAAKAIAVMHGHGESIRDVQARCQAGEQLPRSVALVQIPTTAGTGSEVTRWASIWSDSGEKSSLDQVSGFADEAWVDPALTDGMGSRLTAATGLDAMAHAMESLWGVHHDPLSDLHAGAALYLVRAHLLACVAADGAAGIDEPRDALALAALHAGLALSQTRTAAAHALSYGLTGHFGIEHGLAVGLLCKGVLPVNARLAPERVARVLQALEVSSIAEAQGFIDTVFAAAGLSPSLSGLGVPATATAALVDEALGAERLANNPGALGVAELTALLESVA